MALRIIKKAKVKMAVATRYGFVAWDCDKVWRMLVVSGNVCEIVDCHATLRVSRNDKKKGE